MSKKVKNEIVEPKVEPEACSICSDRYTAVIRRKIICKYCHASACAKCIEQYLLTRHEDAHCLHCRVNYNDISLQEICTKTYLQQTYYKHRQEVLINRERANLPGLQDLAQRTKHRRDRYVIVERLNAEKKELKRVHMELCREYSRLYNEVLEMRIRNPPEDTTERSERLRQIHIQIRESRLRQREKNQEIYNARTGRGEYRYQNPNQEVNDEPAEEEKERKKFIRRCARDGCQGFLSTAWKCGLCEWYSCSTCFAVKSKEHDAPHECNKEDVEMAEMIKKDSKPCPKCGEFITKSSGCDQMFCICCQTPFSWNTGQIVTNGVIHNPHYYEWLRKNGGGTAPRNPADVPCGGYPTQWELVDVTQGARRLYGIGNHPFYEFHRICMEIQEISQRRYRSHIDQNDTNQINVRFLLNEITEKKWGQLLAQVEKRRKRDQEIQEIFGAFRMVAVELINRVQLWRDPEGRSFASLKKNDADEIMNPLLLEINGLIYMINEAFQKLGQNSSVSVPQIVLRMDRMGNSYYNVSYNKFGKKRMKIGKTSSSKANEADASVASVAASASVASVASTAEAEVEAEDDDMDDSDEDSDDESIEEEPVAHDVGYTVEDYRALVAHIQPALPADFTYDEDLEQAIRNSLDVDN